MALNTSGLARLNPFKSLSDRDDAVWTVRYGALALAWMALANAVKGGLMLDRGEPLLGAGGPGVAATLIAGPLLIAAPLAFLMWRRQSRSAALVGLLAEMAAVLLALAAIAAGQQLEGVLLFDLVAAVFGLAAARAAAWLARPGPAEAAGGAGDVRPPSERDSAAPAPNPYASAQSPAALSASTPGASAPGNSAPSTAAPRPAAATAEPGPAPRMINVIIAIVALSLAGVAFALIRAARTSTPESPAPAVPAPFAAQPAPAALPVPAPVPAPLIAEPQSGAQAPTPSATLTAAPAAAGVPVPLFPGLAWTDLGATAGVELYAAAPPAQGLRPLAWMRYEALRPSPMRDESGVATLSLSSVGLFQFDCRRRRARLIDARYYRSPALVGQIATAPVNAPWAAVLPNGRLAGLMARACG